MKLVAIDVETTQKNNAVGKFKASPHHPDNHIVYFGSYDEEDGFSYSDYKEHFLYGSTQEDFFACILESQVLIGHNIKFDLHYFNKLVDVEKWLREGGQIWDTMVAEYVLSGQQRNTKTKGSLSLDGLAKVYGLPVKDDKIKEYFEAGIGAEDIPEEEIVPYLEGDCTTTYKIAMHQMKEAMAQGVMPLILNMMEAVASTWVMEKEGTQLNGQDMLYYREEIVRALNRLEDKLTNIACSIVGEHFDYNPNSDQQLSALLFGGVVKREEDVEQKDEDGNPLVYKSGKKKGMVKTKKEIREIDVTCGLSPPAYSSVETARGWKVDEEVLSDIAKNIFTARGRLASSVLEYRELKKECSTYIDGLLSLVWHDGLLHPDYNMTHTETGRLSCSSPNLQNVKR